MTTKSKNLLMIGILSILLEIARMYYYTNSVLDVASCICFSTFLLLDLYYCSEEEQRDIDVPLSKDIDVPMSKDIEYEEDKMEIHLIEQELLDKVKRFTPEFLESKSITFLKEQRFFLYHELRLNELRLAKFTLDKELVEKLQATYDLVCDTYSKYQAPLNGKLFDTRILFKKDVSQIPLISLIEIRNALKWSLRFNPTNDSTRIKKENRLNEVEEQLRKIDPDYFNGLKVMDDPINSL